MLPLPLAVFVALAAIWNSTFAFETVGNFDDGPFEGNITGLGDLPCRSSCR